MPETCCSNCENERHWRTLCNGRKGFSPYGEPTSPVPLHKYQIKITKQLIAGMDGNMGLITIHVLCDGDEYDPGDIITWTNKLNEIVASGKCKFTNGYINNNSKLYMMLDSKDEQIPIPFESTHTWKFGYKMIEFRWEPQIITSSVGLEWYDEHMVDVLSLVNNTETSEEVELS